jgi:hypothetical protein
MGEEGEPVMAVAQLPDPRERWEERLREAARKSDASQWEIGDAIREADEAWGDTYTLAEQITGKEYKTLRNYATVCRAFDKSRRRDNLTFGHHAAVAGRKEDDQDKWLDLATKKDLSVATLRLKMREAGNGTGNRANAARYVVKPAPEADVLWVKAATKRKMEVQEWLTLLANREVGYEPGEGSGEGEAA